MIGKMRWLLLLAVLLLPPDGFAEDKFFDSADVRIHYVEQGSGEAVVLVHGYGDSLEWWLTNGVLANLAEDHRVIALDCRGHGHSDKPRDPKNYGAQMALDVVRLLDHLGLPRAHIVGFSMGANITAQLLTMRPDRFATAILGGAAGRLNWSPEDDRRAEIEATEMEQGTLRSLILRLSPPDEPKPTDEEIKKRSEASLAGEDRRALAAVRRSNHNQAITGAQMASVTVPTLGIVGSADPNREKFLELKKVMPKLEFVLIDGATHSGARGAAGRPEFLRAVRDFIMSHRISDR